MTGEKPEGLKARSLMREQMRLREVKILRMELGGQLKTKDDF